MSGDEKVQQEEAADARQGGEVPAEDASSLPSKALIEDAIEWKRQWRMGEDNPPNGYADDLLLTLARAYVAGVLREGNP